MNEENGKKRGMPKTVEGQQQRPCYTIVFGSSIWNLGNEVDLRVGEGWKLYESVFKDGDGDLCQALVKNYMV